MLRPMIPLAINIAVPDEQTRLTRLEIDNTSPLLAAALSAAACRHAFPCTITPRAPQDLTTRTNPAEKAMLYTFLFYLLFLTPIGYTCSRIHTPIIMPRSSSRGDSLADDGTSVGDDNTYDTSRSAAGSGSNNRYLTKIFISCEEDAVGSVHRAWAATVLLMTIFFIVSIIEGKRTLIIALFFSDD